MIFKYLLSSLGISLTLVAQGIPGSGCPSSVLSRFQTHLIAPGETLESIAEQYDLIPGTLIKNNPVLAEGSLAVGTEIVIPPINGILVEVPPKANWRDLEASYGVKADLLFEVNGCEALREVVFIPGIVWETPDFSRLSNYTGFEGYPLPEKAEIGLGYGWQDDYTQAQNLFHSGIDLLAEVGTPVLAVESGIVVYAEPDDQYGNLIVINHEDALQTRYAHLTSFLVSSGQVVEKGTAIGTVGVSGKPDLDVSHLHFEVRYHTTMGWLAQDPAIHLIK
ncbi:M23 family metallopeptidase [Gloeocapsa sp. PCC 73106]|uniref:LysM peptidoglycan-binding domain-containing M23 family metallopeptidase n=1 Tax=Gloeocapsa sp. PCC 73106 TaxID=102232 RepID=UPI0002ACDBDB|nr:M23 family metallopeptidase [Gloeocapsa sp. PCC 73106]ELR96837.1 metalloendopeptidase-like membrane protein [Gloeocapsa sp. PCC 73106]